jgi:hypothetical protein
MEELPLRILMAAELPLVMAGRIAQFEGNEGTTDFVFNVQRTSTSGSASVSYRTADSTARAGSDYIATSGKVTFAPGEYLKKVTVKVIGDIERENAEYFTLQLFNPSGVRVSSDWFGEGAIGNDDGDPNAHFELPNAPDFINENAGSIDFELKKVGNPDVTISINYTTQEHRHMPFPQYGARAGKDFIHTAGTLVLGPGEMAKTISVPIIDDAVAEPNKTFRFVFFGEDEWRWDNPSIYIQLSDDDPATISLEADPFVMLDEAGQRVMRFTARQSTESALHASASFATEDGSAAAGIDYWEWSARVEMQGGLEPRYIDVPIWNPQEADPPLEFHLRITSINNAVPATPFATAAIRYDHQEPAVRGAIDSSIADSTLVRANLTFHDNFRVRASSITGRPLIYMRGPSGYRTDCDYRNQANLVDGSSIDVPCDFAAPGGIWDASDDGSYAIYVAGEQVRDVAGNTMAGDVVAGFDVVDGQLHPTDIMVNSVAGDEGQNGTNEFVFDVVLFEPPIQEVSVDYLTADMTAEAGNDYIATSGTLRYASGETVKRVTVQSLGDTDREYPESFALVLTSANGAVLTEGFRSLGTIENDDGDPDAHFEFSQPLFPVVSENSGRLTLEIRKVGNPDKTISTSCSTQTLSSADAARAGTDFEPMNQTIILGPGELLQTVHIALVDDEAVEPIERFKLVCGQEFLIQVNDDEKATLRVSAEPFVRYLGGVTPWILVFPVKLSAPSSFDVSFDFQTEDGSALAGAQYHANWGHQEIPRGQTEYLITVALAGKPAENPQREFSVKLTNVEGAVADNVSASGAIRYDRARPKIVMNRFTAPRRGDRKLFADFTYSDNFKMPTWFIDDFDIFVKGPKGFVAECSARAPLNHTDETRLFVPCAFSAPGGRWDWRDNGSYSFHVNGAGISDSAGNRLGQKLVRKFVINLRKHKAR